MKKDAPKRDVSGSMVLICGVLFILSLLYFVQP